MSFISLFDQFPRHEQIESVNFAADPRLKSLIYQRIREIEREILDLQPGMADPVEYIRLAQDLYARKQEVSDLFNLVQEILDAAMPQQKDHGDV